MIGQPTAQNQVESLGNSRELGPQCADEKRVVDSCLLARTFVESLSMLFFYVYLCVAFVFACKPQPWFGCHLKRNNHFSLAVYLPGGHNDQLEAVGEFSIHLHTHRKSLSHYSSKIFML